jgi:uncharacterized membrane protein
MLLAGVATWLSVPPDALMPVHWGPTLQPDRSVRKIGLAGLLALMIVPMLTLVVPSILTRASWSIDPRTVPAAWWGSHAVLVALHAWMCLSVLGAT